MVSPLARHSPLVTRHSLAFRESCATRSGLATSPRSLAAMVIPCCNDHYCPSNPGCCRMTGRPAESSGITCGRCGERIRPGDRFCAFCGTAAPVAGCERCNAPLGAADRFCPRCGTGTRTGTESAIAAANQPGVEEPNPWAQVAARLRAATAGEFEILRELGRGGMAAVYLAHEVALNRKVAIKVMSPALLTGEGMVRRFRQEAVTVANMG